MRPNPHTGWVPVYGDFEVDEQEIHFKGRQLAPVAPTVVPGAEARQTGAAPPGAPQVTFGLLLSSDRLADGDLSADVVFETATPESICELAVSYDPNASQIVAAGIGGPMLNLYGIREFGGPRTSNPDWWYYRFGGERSALRAGRTYHIEARFRGAIVTLLIDGVPACEAAVSSPVGRPRNAGIFCKGGHQITIRNFTVKALKPRAFMVTQFSTEYEAIYADVVKQICGDYDVNIIRADEVSGPGLIIGDIVKELSAAQLIVADITPVNSNVYFEVGYAMAMGKPIILLAKKGTQLPFDVAGFRVLFYEDTIGGKSRLEDALRRHISAILAE